MRHDRSTPLLSRAALLLAAAVGLALPAVGESYQEALDKAFDAAGINRVRIQNVNGSVKIATWDKPSVQLSAIKKAKGSRAEETVKETEIRISRSGGNLDIETIPPKKSSFFGFFSFGDGGQKVEVTFDLTLPAGLAVDVETVNGRISAESRTGPLTLNTVNGSIRVDAHEGSLNVGAVNGSVDVGFAGALHDAEIETVNGSVTVSCRKDSSFRYELETVNGKIRSDFVDVTVSRGWGPKEARGSVADGRARLSVETVNGEVRLESFDPGAPGPAPKR